MAGLAEFRAQHPQYDDLSDNDLADKLHAKFYSDMPKADYYARMGLQAPTEGAGRFSRPVVEPQGEREPTWADTAMAGISGLSKGIVGAVTAPYRAVDWVGEKLTGGDFLPNAEDMPAYRPYLKDSPEPVGDTNKLIKSAGEVVGSSAIPSGVILNKAEKWSKLAPETLTRAVKQSIGQTVARAPGAAVAADVVAGAGAGVAQKAAEEEGAGPGWQMLAGFAGGVAPLVGAQAAGRAVGGTAKALSPQLARLNAQIADIKESVANAPRAVYEKIGLPKMSADGGIPDGALPARMTPARAHALELAAQQFHRSGYTPQQAREALARSQEAVRFHSSGQAQNPTFLADLHSGLARFAGSLGRSSPEAGNFMERAIAGRQTGVTPQGGMPTSTYLPTKPRLSKPMLGREAERQFGTRFNTPENKPVPMGQTDRMSDALKRALVIEDEAHHGHGANAYQTDKQMTQKRRETANALYPQAWKEAESFDLNPAFEKLATRFQEINDPGVESVLRRAGRLFTRKGGNNAPLSEASELRLADLAKRRLDALVDKYKLTDSFLYNALNDFRKDVLNAIHGGDRLKPTRNIAYGKARDHYSTQSEALEAIEIGRKLYRGDADAGLDAFNSLEIEGNRKLARLGYWSEFNKAARDGKKGADKTLLLDSDRQQEILEVIIPRSQGADDAFHNRPERFGRNIDMEQATARTRREVLGGSQTAGREVDDDAFQMMNAATEAINLLKQGRMTAAGMKYAEHLLTRLLGTRADAAQEAARMLFTANPDEQLQILAAIEARMGPDRFAYFTRSIRQLQGGAVSSTAGTAGVVNEPGGGQ